MKKILIIRFSSIGDIVLTTPVVRCVKEQVSNTEIHYLTKKAFVGILSENPYISKIHSFDKNVFEVTKELKRVKFDLIIDLHNNLRSMQIKKMLGRPSKTFSKLNFQKWLLVNLKQNRMSKEHVVDRYLKTVLHLGVKNDNKGVDYFIPTKDEVDVETLPETHKRGYIGFVIGAQHFTKQLPIEKIVAICKKANQPIVLLGGKADESKANKIESELGVLIYNACGKYNLNQSASLVKQADKIFSHDTGLMHIAAAFKKEIVSYWGNTVPDFGFYPYMPDEKSRIVEVKNLSCRPCSKIGHQNCPKGHFKCMMDIEV